MTTMWLAATWRAQDCCDHLASVCEEHKQFEFAIKSLERALARRTFGRPLRCVRQPVFILGKSVPVGWAPTIYQRCVQVP